VADGLPAAELDRRIADGSLQALPGIGPATAEVIIQAAGGREPAYLTKLLGDAQPSEPTSVRAALRGDCYTHSDWCEWA